jgi:hypothetical protein
MGLATTRREGGPFYWYWMLQVSDDIGTPYADSNNGTRCPSTGGPATHATRDLGARVPDEATRLMIAIRPASGWLPPAPWVRELKIDLRLQTVISAK